ncbi:MAG: hypothetical protein AB8F78_17135 [Saprospiraceae bacterium]
MIDSNQLHPLPRYGLEVLRFYSSQDAFESEEALVNSAVAYIEEALTKFMISPKEMPDEEKESVLYSYHADAKPGKANGQISAYGFFSAPHIVTGNNAADIVKEAKARLAEARKDKKPSSVELKKSFAPTVSKINAGTVSMSNPRVGFVEALLTMAGSLSALKPASYDYDLGSNVALVPDMPAEAYKSYLRIISKLLTNTGEEIWSGSYKSKKFGRPFLFKGNFAKAPRGVDIGALGLLSAIGQYAKEASDLSPDEAKPVLEALANRPIYLFANGGSSQQYFSHHLIELSLSGALYAAAESINRVEILSIEGAKFSNPKWDRFRITAGHFLTFFQSAYARDFFAFRASYPRAFQPIFKTYFMQIESIPESIVKSAEVYGQRLNLSAYIGAQDEIKDDQRRGRSGQSLKEYKNRILTQLESSIASAKTGADLISRLSTIVGRSSNLDFPEEAAEFMREAVSSKNITVDQAKQLATAFMRLQTPKKEAKVDSDTASDNDESVDESNTSAMDLSSF